MTILWKPTRKRIDQARVDEIVRLTDENTELRKALRDIMGEITPHFPRLEVWNKARKLLGGGE